MGSFGKFGREEEGEGDGHFFLSEEGKMKNAAYTVDTPPVGAMPCNVSSVGLAWDYHYVSRITRNVENTANAEHAFSFFFFFTLSG